MRRAIIGFFVVGLLCLSLPLTLTAQTADNILTPEMVVDLKYVTDVTMDPTGQYVAYSLLQARAPDDKPGPRYSEIWVASTEGNLRQYTYKPVDANDPAFSPDGEHLAFLSKREAYDDKTQVYVMPLHGGEARKLTDAETGVRSFRWSPDGAWIAYTSTDPKTEEQKKAEEAGRDWKVVDQNYRHHRLWAVNVSTGEANKIVEQERTVWNFEWAPDGKRLVVQASEEPTTDASYMFKKVYTVPASGGELKLLTETEGKLGAMAWSPDGRRIAFLGAVDLSDPATHALYVVPAEGGKAENLIEGFEGTPEWLDWLDNNTIAFTAVEGTQYTFNSIPASGGQIKGLVEGHTGFSEVSFSGDRTRFACARSTEKFPSEVFWRKVGDEELVRLTHSNPGLEDIRLAEQEEIRYQARDGLEITALLMKPLDYEPGKRYPLVVQVHGGPESAYVDGWNTSYSRWTQLLASSGYVVFMPNYRASTGRGVEYAKADHRDLAGSEFEDVLDGIDYLIEQGLVDPNRVGMGGWSYGGYFSAWATTKYSERFQATVVGAALINWHSFMGTSDIPWEEALVHWDLWCYDKPELCWERSPIAHVKNAQTPALIIHGEEDLRVPVSQGWELYTALKVLEVPTEFVIYPREPHGLRDRAHQLDCIRRSLAWFDRYLKGEAGTD